MDEKFAEMKVKDLRDQVDKLEKFLFERDAFDNLDSPGKSKLKEFIEDAEQELVETNVLAASFISRN